jgi:hypothetical protein
MPAHERERSSEQTPETGSARRFEDRNISLFSSSNSLQRASMSLLIRPIVLQVRSHSDRVHDAFSMRSQP